MEEDNAFQTTDTTGQEKKNSEPQEDWKDYAYGGKSLLDNSNNSLKPVGLEQKRNLVIGYVPPVGDTDMKQEDSEPTQQED